MKTLSIFTYASALLIGSLSIQTVSAQASLSGNYLLGNQTNNPFYITAAPVNGSGPYIELINNNFTSPANRAGSIGYIAGYNPTFLSPISHTFYSRTSTGGYVSNMRILQNGQVQIGQQAPNTSQTDYGLSVDGKIVAKAIYVTTPGTWADFVFEPSYKFLPLPSLEQYLQLNKHLPHVPSAAEVAANGYNLGDMDVKLLQSVEELTLYLIELNKRNDHLAAELAQLRAQVANQASSK